MTKRNDIIWLDEVNSTNEYARMHIATLDNLSVVAAMSQTKGKGRGEHKWHSESGKNLLFSIILKSPDIPARNQAEISMRTVRSLIVLLENHGVKAWMKPPNDIWVEDRKICGILIEHSVRGEKINWSIIGIGLNVNQKEFPSDLPNPTSMALEGEETDIKRLLEEFIEIFSREMGL